MEELSNLLFEIFAENKPYLQAWISDLFRALLLWTGIAILHWVQTQTLKWGWSTEIVSGLDTLEEYTVFVTVFLYFLGSVCAYAFNTYRGLIRGRQ